MVLLLDSENEVQQLDWVVRPKGKGRAHCIFERYGRFQPAGNQDIPMFMLPFLWPGSHGGTLCP